MAKKQKVKITIEENGEVTLENKGGDKSLVAGMTMLALLKAVSSGDYDHFRKVGDDIYYRLHPREDASEQ